MREVRWVIVIPVLCLCGIAQSGLAHSIKIAGVEPDFVIGGAALLCIRSGAIRGMHTGMFAGLVRDAMSGGPFGITVLILGTFGLIAGHVFSDHDDMIMPAAPTLLILICGTLMITFLVYDMWMMSMLHPGYTFLRFIVPATIYTAGLCLLFLRAQRAIAGRGSQR